MRLGQVLYRYIWAGNEHALWYLCAAVIGFAITQLMLRFCKPRTVLIISCLFLLIGCIKSTWSPFTEQVLRIKITDFLGSRNGLFYAFPYTALGMYLAKFLFIYLWDRYIYGFTLFLAVSLSAIIFGMLLMNLAENNKMKFLKILY